MPRPVDLVPLLKKLRLGPIADTLPERIALARREQLDYASFLEIILSDEVNRRDNRRLQMRMRAAGFEDTCSLEDLGLHRFTPQESADLYELIINRHRVSSFIVTSNRAVEEWLSLFEDPILGNSALDRLANTSFRSSSREAAIGKDSLPTRLSWARGPGFSPTTGIDSPITR